MITTHSLWHQSAKKSEICSTELSEDQTKGILLKAKYSLISLGTERLIANGFVPEELYLDMAVPFMDGDFSFPVKYGYSLLAEVIEKHHPMQGALVHLLHPHQDYLRVPENVLFEIPKEVPPKRATLASNLETALNAIWDSGVNIGDRVLIVGFGMIGSLIAQILADMPGVNLTILEIDKDRIALGKKMNFPIGDKISDSNFDIAFHTSGSTQALQQCIDGVGKEGKIIELSWYGKRKVELSLGGTFHSQRKQIISSQVSQLPANRLARWNYHRRKQLVFELLKNPKFDQHISLEIPFLDAPKFFDEIRRGGVKDIGVCIKY